MEIFRRVYCEGTYEGVYQLIRFDEKYWWQYIAGTHVGAENDFDYPKLNLEKDRNLCETSHYTYSLDLRLEFKEEDLEQSYETIKTIKD